MEERYHSIRTPKCEIDIMENRKGIRRSSYDDADDDNDDDTHRSFPNCFTKSFTQIH